MITVIYSLDEKAEKRRRREQNLPLLSDKGPIYMICTDDLVAVFSDDTLSLEAKNLTLRIECVKSFSIVKDEAV